MPFVPNTPEAHSALVNPTTPTACRGVFNDGKPCKRELVRNNIGQPQSGIITIINKQQAYFCNKHQGQAQDVVLRHTASFARKRALVGRGSMDTLIEQVEMLVGGDGKDATVSTTVVSTTRKVPRDKDPFRGPLMEEDEEDSPNGSPKPPSPPKGYGAKQNQGQSRQSKKPRKRRGLLMRFLMGCCCVVEEDPDDEKYWSEKRREAELRSAAAAVVDGEFPKQGLQVQKKGARAVHVAFKSSPPTPPLPLMHPHRKFPASAMVKNESVSNNVRASKAPVVGIGLSPSTPQSKTQEDDSGEEPVLPIVTSNLSKEQKKLLRLIPKTVTGKGLARLQEELLKPFSPKDESGYIYMFWLTDSPLSPLPTPSGSGSNTGSNASSSGSLLRPQPRNDRSNAERLRRATVNASVSPGGTTPKVLFKIGRANNVQRRLHEWTAQCGYNLSLIRYYPHTSATSTTSSKGLARKVPNSHRIERLIHLELSATPGANPDKKCDACGKTHKEWFEVEASREGILAVDSVIKRWVAFGERSANAVANAAADPAAKSTTTNKSPLQPRQPQQQRPSPPARHNVSSVKMYEVKKDRSARPKVKPKPIQRQAKPTAKRRISKPESKDGEYGDSVDSDEEWGEEDYSP